MPVIDDDGRGLCEGLDHAAMLLQGRERRFCEGVPPRRVILRGGRAFGRVGASVREGALAAALLERVTLKGNRMARTSRSRWRIGFRGGLWSLGILAGSLAAAPDARADALSAVQLLREGGCGGIVPAVPPLRRSTRLDWIAEQWAAGRPLLTAAERSGYPAKSTAAWHVTGPDSSLVQLLRRSDCRKIASPTLRDIGVYRRGESTWLVLASAYAAPTGSQVTGSQALVGPQAAAGSRTLPGALAFEGSPAPMLATQAVELVNEVRARGARCGTRSFGPAPALKLSQTLAGVALAHATDMAEHDYFEHMDLSGQSPADRVRAVGYREKLVGENIAYGPETLAEVVKGWLDSPGHCENMMDPRFAEMGIGYASGEGERRGLYWVQLLAAPRD